MPDRTTLVTFCAISISIGMIAVCGIVANIICGDVSDFYDASMKEFKAFQVCH
uniref:Col_cuticle_N domain-containing protein n=1 Tax=Angiostrongylus cantonensis TaxID=6313 RepID=A0A0K0D6M2_ANGCA